VETNGAKIRLPIIIYADIKMPKASRRPTSKRKLVKNGHHVGLYIQLYTHTYIYKHIHTYMPTYIHIYIFSTDKEPASGSMLPLLHLRKRRQWSTYMYIHVCMYVCMYVEGSKVSKRV
jgi:hypothetical protein